MEREEIKKEIEKLKKQIIKYEKTLARPEKLKVVEITDEYIKFNDGRKITYDHEQDCCEHNYADFMQIKDTGIENFEFDTKEDDIQFEEAGYGFRFGDKRVMLFVPCYSDQNGYYSNLIDIYFDGEKKLCDIVAFENDED